METAARTGSTARDSTSLRAIDGVYRPPPLHWVGDGFRVAGYLSVVPDAVKKLSPFLLLDYHPAYDYSPTERPRGVGVHPHRGFETVTIAWQGSVAHHDSTGRGGVIGPGDVQWMTAASGILHKEYHEAEFARRGGTFHMAQLWVNLPRAHKRDAPGYQAITADQMGSVITEDSVVRVVAGEHAGVKGPARTFTRVHLLDARVRAGGSLQLEFPAGDNLALLLTSGEVVLQGATRVRADDLVVFRPGAERIELDAEQDTHLLVLGGEPIDEPVVQYGPFVMNTEREIAEAFDDFQRGKFGRLA